LKFKISLIILTILFVSIFAVSAGAQSDWEAVSGFNITNVTLDTYNDTIDRFNGYVDTGLSGSIPTSDFTEFENIDRVPLLYLGAKRPINEDWDLNIRYEYIFGEVEQNYSVGADSYDNSIAVGLHGLTLLGDYSINDNWYASGGVGYHWGTKDTKLNGPVYDTIGPLSDSFDAGEQEYDLENGVSLRAGIGYDREFAENWTFNGKIDYLYIELEDEGQGNIYSKGFSYTAGLSYNF